MTNDLTILVCVCVCACSVLSNSLGPHELQPARFLCPWNFPGKNTGVGCHFLFQEIPDPGITLLSPASASGLLTTVHVLVYVKQSP